MSVDSNTPLDPRVQVELEKLNSATDNINRFEVELDEAKSEFQKLLAESVDRIKKATHKLGNSIQAAKPYYEARIYVAQLTKETQNAHSNYEKARSIHAAAKEMVYLAEQGLGEKSTLDMACQEMLSHGASRVNQSQIECAETRNLLKICELKQEVANNRVAKLQSQLKSAIRSSSLNIRRSLLMINAISFERDLLYQLPYYETRANYNGVLKTQKQKINDLERNVSEAKITYQEALKNLEQISEDIHRMRKEREACLKSESCDKDVSNEEDEESDQVEDVINRLNKSEINSTDEYLEFPSKLSVKSSPIRQQKLDKHDCPHLYRDYKDHKPNSEFTSNQVKKEMTLDEIEQWTEIRLTNSESSSSGYSHHSFGADDQTPVGSDENSSSSNESRHKKVTCRTLAPVYGQNNGGHHSGCDGETESRTGKPSWLSKSEGLKASSRRQSLDLLIDASDRFKDVFTNSFQKVGKSLERRNSESEVCQTETSDFFSFRSDPKDGLSDEQILNLELEAIALPDILSSYRL